MHFSIGIPVKNEENNIEPLIESIFEQTFLPQELIVCVNGSRDKTYEIVSGMTTKHKSIKLITSEPGKASAWNKIVENSNHSKMVFCDGDIRFGTKDTLEILINEFLEKSVTMYGASIIQLPSKRTKPKQLKIVPSGQLYVIDLEKLGISSIPENIILEDAYLAGQCYPDVDTSKESFFYSLKPNIRDIVSTQIRILKGIKQLIDIGMGDIVTEILYKRYNKTKADIILKLVNYVQTEKENGLWKETLSTKKSFKDDSTI